MESKKPDGESYLPCPEDRDGERAYIGEISEKGKTTATAKKRRTAAPDRKKHLKDLTEITATIKKKETAIVSFSVLLFVFRELIIRRSCLWLLQIKVHCKVQTRQVSVKQTI